MDCYCFEVLIQVHWNKSIIYISLCCHDGLLCIVVKVHGHLSLVYKHLHNPNIYFYCVFKWLPQVRSWRSCQVCEIVQCILKGYIDYLARGINQRGLKNETEDCSWRFGTFINKVSLLTRLWKRSKCYHIGVWRNEGKKCEHMENSIPLTV